MTEALTGDAWIVDGAFLSLVGDIDLPALLAQIELFLGTGRKGHVRKARPKIVAPRLPFVQQLEAQQVAPLARVKPPATPTLVGTSPAATAQTPPALTTIEHDRGR